ncbi:glycosyltransferase family 2 protein [Inhella proteolytica]|uniref:Glycosyltransferase family 2 protein n=1 Tax=Inhella proteolytica TaxID=2795029 RepID=A0A931J6E4_9BURK|nr:glycosyltransferase family 2 protein [Inhella proteolytica]MBH9578384.1 glycosyltransferase family 2 protein [Inhella proteolytica]
MIELTVLMPCLNEALTVETCIRKALSFFRRAGINGEIVVADNGSTDGSVQLAQAAGARVLVVRERGYGAALAAGVRAARGRYIIMGDSDDSYDFSRLDAFLEALRAGSDLVMGNRFAGGIAEGAMPPLHRYLGNPVLSFIGRLFFSSPIRDFHCGLRGFVRDAVLALDLQSPGMEYASEMVVKATLYGLQISEVPTTLAPDGRGRPPHLRSWRDGWRHLRFLLIHAPAWLFLWPGLVLLCVGLSFAALLVRGPLPLGFLTLDFHTLLYAAVAACLGLQMVLFAGLSFVHCVAIGVLPAMPERLKFFQSVSLERGLVIGLVLVVSGMLMALRSVQLWSGEGFKAIDPGVVMRVAIPAAALVLAGMQVSTSAFLLEYIRLAPRVRERGGRGRST